LKSANEISHDKQKIAMLKGDIIVNKISSEQMDEYKKFLKKNVPNSFALD